MPTGPSTTQSPYLVPSEPNVSFVSLLSAGDQVGFKADGVTPYRMVGVPDGLGALDLGNGQVMVLMNHEIGNTQGAVREHGSAGSFVSKLIIDKNTLQVVKAEDLAKQVFQDNDGDGVFTVGTTAWTRFCSGDLPAMSALYNSATNLGSSDRLYLTGEESGAEGRAFAFVTTGIDAGKAFELPAIGNMSFENILANPFTGDRTVVMANDDSSVNGQVYLYSGMKQSAGNPVERAGLTNGQLYGIKVAGLTQETDATSLPGDTATFTTALIPNAKTLTGAQIDTASVAAGVTNFNRPEDGAWDPSHPNWYYFQTTASATGNSRLWRLEYNDVNNPAAGGTIKMLLRGDEGHRMLDNLTITADGKIVTLEDVGNNPRLGKIWQYDPVTDQLEQIGQHDPARFVGTSTTSFNQDEESSGVIDVTSIFGSADRQAFLLDVQAHYNIPGEIVEGGQLDLMYVDTPRNGGPGADVINGGAGSQTLSGNAGNDTIRGGSGNDTLFGDDGDDVLDGGAGYDSINGGAGIDTASFASNPRGVIVDLNAQVADDGIDFDRMSSIENVLGSNFDDTIITNSMTALIDGGAGNDTVNMIGIGRALIVDLDVQAVSDGRSSMTLRSIENFVGSSGDDTFFGSSADNTFDGGNGGADRFFGFGGSDTVSYASNLRPVIIDLTTQRTFDGLAQDTLSSIENATGSAGNDTIYGDNGANILDGGPGGADLIYGFGGSDTVSYASSTRGVIIDLSAQSTFDGVNNDRLNTIENAIGSKFNDTVYGSEAGDRIEGGAGNDQLYGFGGNDVFVFNPGSGRDDVFTFTAGGTDDSIELHSSTIKDFASVLTAAVQTGANTVITLAEGDVITLHDVVRANLTSADFTFA